VRPTLPERVRREGTRLAKHVQQLVRRIEEPTLREAALQYPEAGGKLLRPALAAMSCEAAGGEPTMADPLAASVELVHTFSLVHDDLMDGDEMRRGVPSVHADHGESTSILAGDALFALAFEALGDLPETPPGVEVVGDVARTARTLCEGQRLDMSFEEDRPDVDRYESMIEKKTAVLFACATRNAALLGASDEHVVDTLSRFGWTLGMGFQIQDDLLDLVGDPEDLGKPQGSDVVAGKKTHPLLAARQRLEGEPRARFDAILTGEASREDVEWVLHVAEDTGALEASRQRAAGFFDQSQQALTTLPESPAREDLLETLAWLRERDR
jgi:geranylgeranyl diphosphate synthase type I